MIINGGSRRDSRFFARHLAKGEENERAILCEIRGLAAETIHGAFQEMDAIALGSQCENHFYHANINPQQAEILTLSQWSQATDRLEENLGLTGHARLIVEHHKKGRTHRHAIWLRIAVATMRAVPMTDDYQIHQATARQLEAEFGHQPGQSVLGPKAAKGRRPSRRPRPWETFRGHASGIDPHAMKVHITALYSGSASVAEFVSALKDHGYRLVKADRRDYCIVDARGHVHSLARRLDGVSASALSGFLKDLDRKNVLSVTQAKTKQPSPHLLPLIATGAGERGLMLDCGSALTTPRRASAIDE